MGCIENADDLRKALDWLSARDPRLGTVRTRVEGVAPVPMRRIDPGFAAMVEVVCTQQISRASAAAILARLQEYVDPLTPESVLAIDEPTMRAVGLSRSKLSTLKSVSKAVLDGTLDLHAVCEMPAAEAIAAICAVRGLGPWTAGVYLLFSGGHPDIMPKGDIALQWSASWMLGRTERIGADELDDLAKAWSPHRSTAARLLWANYALVKGRPILP